MSEILWKMLGGGLLIWGVYFVFKFIMGCGLSMRYFYVWVPFFSETFTIPKKATFFQRANLIMVGMVYIFFGALLAFGNK